MELSLYQQAHYTDRIAVWKPQPPSAGSLGEASDPVYVTTPTQQDIPCRLHLTPETDHPAMEGRTKAVLILVLDKFYLPQGINLQDTWLIQLQTPGHPYEGAFWIAQGNPKVRASSGLMDSNYQMVYGKRTPAPTFAPAPVDPTQPPPAPSLQTLTPGNGQIFLAWATGGGSTQTFILWRSSDNGNSFQQILAGYTGLSYTDNNNGNGLTNGTTYCYYLQASDAFGNLSLPSNIMCGAPIAPQPPSAPTNLVAVGGNGLVNLSWDNAAGVTWNLYRGPQSGQETLLASGLTNPVYQDLAVQNGTTYFYYVTAVAGGLESGHSNEANATPSGGTQNPPPTPTGLVATAQVEAIALTWNPVVGAVGYRIKRTDLGSGQETYFDTSPVASYTDTLVCDGVQFWFVVSAYNTIGESGNSNEATAIPLPSP